MLSLIPRVRVNYTFEDLIKALFSGRGKGKNYNLLRKEICKYFGVANVLLTSSGRGSIFMLLNYLPQSKVIVPAYTCKVVVEAALLAGKEIIYAPTSRRTFNISSLPPLDNDCIVIATHQYGLPCDIKEIVSKCREAGAIVIEDCAGSLGTKIDGKLTGLFGDFAIFSFDSSKLINVPSKGGFIIAKKPDKLLEIVDTTPMMQCSFKYKIKHLSRGVIYIFLKSSILYRLFHYITMGRKGEMQLEDHSGIDTRLTEFYTHDFYEWQASIALRQFKQIENIIKKRQEIYSFYNKFLTNPLVEKPNVSSEAACIRYALLTKDKENFYNKCVRKGVDLGFSFNSLACPPKCKEEHIISKDIFNLPSYYNLSKKECKKIIDVINSIKSW